MYLFQKSLRILIIGLLLSYFIVATAMLGVRYLILPNINQWRPVIEKQLSKTIGADVTIGEIVASWSGFNPSVAIENLRLRDRTTQQELLFVPDAFAVVSWRSIFAMDVRLRQLEMNGVHVSGSRRTDGRFVLAGLVLDQSEQSFEFPADTALTRWLLNQGQVVVRQATFVWNDHLRNAPELAINGVELSISNSIFRHQLRLSASLPPELGHSVEIILQTDNVLNPLSTHPLDEAEIFFEINDLRPNAWHPWLDIPDIQGRFAARMWLSISEGLLGRTSVDVAGAHAGLSLRTDAPLIEDPTILHAEKFQLRLSGWIGDLLDDKQLLMFKRSPNRAGAALTLTGQGAAVDSSAFEPRLLHVGDVSVNAQLTRNAQQKLGLHITHFGIETEALKADLRGSWTQTQADVLGLVDITGTIDSLDPTMLFQYVTTDTDAESRQWLRRAIRQGELKQVALTLRGNLSDFPFNLPNKETGLFRLAGQVKDLVIDYDLVAPDQPQWPALTIESGSIALDNLRLSLDSQKAYVIGMHGRPVNVSSFQMYAPDLALNPAIQVRLQSDGLAQDYVAVLDRTPLADTFGIDLKMFEVKGRASMPLSVDFDLDARRAVSVGGQFKLTDGTALLSKENVAIEKLNGTIRFTEDVFEIKELRGEALGGPLIISGEWGQNKKSFAIQGELAVIATEKFQNLTTSLLISGKTTYQADIKATETGGFDVDIRSNLDGLTIKLPPPLGKLASQKRPLSFRLSHNPDGKVNRTALTVTYANVLNGRFERRSNSPQGQAFFTRGAIVMGAPAVLPVSGFAINLGFDRVHWDDWKVLTDQLITLSKQATAVNTAPIFPPLTQIRVRSPEFIFAELTLNTLDLTLNKATAQKWSARLLSKETEGSATWSSGPRGLIGPVIAKFSKLSIGTEEAAAGELPKTEMIDENQWSSMPAIDLTIDDFTFFGSRLGALHLVGENTDNGLRWDINALEISNSHAKLTAKGSWLLKGAERGVALDGKIDIVNLGKLSDQLGYNNRAAEGSGTITATINWTNFPWIYSYSGLNGQANIDLKEGVFQHVNSRSARLLEVLSLQSLQRILSFNFRTGDEFKDGFPWNSIKGDFSMTRGVVHTKDLVVRSPIARIALTGGSDLTKKMWDMEADVRPVLDMSGAAVATAFVVNPVVGLSALVSQFLLRYPIERVMSAKYEVKGPWDDPELIPIGVPAPVQTQTDPGG